MAFLELRQQLKLTQQLVMTPQLQQAIKLLQLSRLELVDTVQQEIEENPLLEEEMISSSAEAANDSMPQSSKVAEDIPAPIERTTEVNMDNQSSLSEINWTDYVNEYESSSTFSPRESGEQTSRFDILSQKPDLRSHLQWQLSLSDVTPEDFEVGLFVLGNLNQDGFLEVSEEEIVSETDCTPETAQKMIAAIQAMDPAGVGARDVRESILLQLKRLHLEDSLPSRIVREHLHLLETKNYKAIARAMKESMANVTTAVKIIVGLDPHPGRAYSDEEPHYIIPDVSIQKVDNEYVIRWVAPPENQLLL
jgi:RNA polymerase sigma-54 factor